MTPLGRIFRSARDASTGVRDLIFPDQCWISEKPVGVESPQLSTDVREAIARGLLANYCRRCGSTVGPHEKRDRENPCQKCPGRDVGVNTLARAGTFSAPLSSVVYQLKFGGFWELARIVGPFLMHAIDRVSTEQRVPVDAVIPLPLHWRRKMRRGFNQAEELSLAICRLGNWPLLQPLRRVKSTHEQARIHYKTRRQDNMKGAFECRPMECLDGKHLWLLDDVCTTGATLHAAATAIRKLAPAIRPASINAVVLCVTERDSPVRVEELDSDDVPDDLPTVHPLML